MLLLTISQINLYLRELLESDEVLMDVWVQGEISTFRRAASGHVYFTLKDDSAALDAVMWRSSAARLSALPRSGDAVLAHGRVSLYETNGRLQLYVDTIQPAGIGILYARFEELKARLEAEGLFDESRKRPLPLLPRRIGIATSAESAARRDIETVLQRRCPLVELLLAPCVVQGEQSAPSIVNALQRLYNAEPPPDLIILARGGGSLEDLWSFNEEAVARAVFSSPVPVITGVGHETDTTMVDFVADLRAPTPSAAAELAVPEMAALQQEIATLRQQLEVAIWQHLGARRDALEDISALLRQRHPATVVAHARQQVDDLLRRAGERATHSVVLRRARLDGLLQQLSSLSPDATLQRGYAVVRRADDGSVVRAADQVESGDRLTIRLSSGHLTVAVIDQTPETDESQMGENTR